MTDFSVSYPDVVVEKLIAAAVPTAQGAVLLGKSNRGSVFAVTRDDQTSVVVKCGFAQFIDQEVAAHQRLTGLPGVVRLVSHGSYSDVKYLVRDYQPQTLLDRLNERPVRLDELFSLFAPIVEVMETLHGVGWAFVDLKPANLVVNDACLQVADLGDVGRLGEVSARATAGFTAPEIHQGGLITVATDTYSLAATIVTTLIGNTEWMASTLDEDLLAAHPQLKTELLAALSPPMLGRRISPRHLLDAFPNPAGEQQEPDTETRLPPHPSSVPLDRPETGSTDALVVIDGPPEAPARAPSAQRPRPGSHVQMAAGASTRSEPTPDLSAISPWGLIALDAPTLDRPPLLPPLAPEPEQVTKHRSLWRSPVLISSVAAGAAMAVLAFVLLARSGDSGVDEAAPSANSASVGPSQSSSAQVAEQLSALRITPGNGNTQLSWDGPDLPYTLILLSVESGPKDATLYVRGRLAFVPSSVTSADACFLVRPATTPVTAPIPQNTAEISAAGGSVACSGAATFEAIRLS
ncbi:protein kinase domain-containing protein [Nakamurella antarctica]|uniref:protein kinase domain-containing protein n=1 Tax=Nakamurella antarctica TaxID=1902245 RepID=UPI0013DE543A|nr:hypothetical protein [Nakamurella antarctica]